METKDIVSTIQSDLAMLNEEEQRRVMEYVRTLIEQKKKNHAQYVEDMMKLVGIGESGLGDGAEEHDHYIYGTPKKSKHEPENGLS